MARNTGRGSRTAGQQHTGTDWLNTSSRPFVVWSEDDEVVIYEGEKPDAGRRHVFTPDEADALAILLQSAARQVRGRFH